MTGGPGTLNRVPPRKRLSHSRELSACAASMSRQSYTHTDNPAEKFLRIRANLMVIANKNLFLCAIIIGLEFINFNMKLFVSLKIKLCLSYLPIIDIYYKSVIFAKTFGKKYTNSENYSN